MNLLDRIASSISPAWGLSRLRHRIAAENLTKYYDGGEATRLRRYRTDNASGNTAVYGAALPLRAMARHLERNHDIFRGALGILTLRTVGPHGITIEPAPRNADGSINQDVAKVIRDLFEDWSLRPEVTYEHDWAAAQRLLARTWFRDGEVLAQTLEGDVGLLDHGTEVPFSLEMIECDQLPMDYNDAGQGIVQGVQINAWGQPRNYFLYKAHPGDVWPIAPLAGLGIGDLKTVSYQRMLHVKLVDRIRQVRGVSHFASVITRIEDLKDLEESERIAAKVAASMAAAIKKGNPDTYDPDAAKSQGARNMNFTPGMIFDDLLPGESIETIDTKRPNTTIVEWREGQLRAMAAGIGTGASSISKRYDNNYSAQRQELIESWDNYTALQMEFIARLVRPVYHKFIATALSAGKLALPRGMRPQDILKAVYHGPQMPWIDPVKEVEAWGALEDRRYASGPEIIRKRGRNPQDVIEQEAVWQEQLKERGLEAAPPAAQPAPAEPPPANARGVR